MIFIYFCKAFHNQRQILGRIFFKFSSQFIFLKETFCTVVAQNSCSKGQPFCLFTGFFIVNFFSVSHKS
jgi:hypothetical protein